MNRVEQYQESEEQRSSEALESDIQSTRDRMDKTLDTLSTKLNPERYIEGAGNWMKDKIDGVDTDSFKDTAKHVGKKTGNIVRDHPLPVALGALTIASLFMRRSDDYDRKIDDPYIPAHPNATGPTGTLNPTLDPDVKQLPEHSDNGKSSGRAAETAHAVKSGLSTAAHRTGDRFSRGKEEYPAAMCLGAMALGFLAAFALPRTRRENEAYGESADEFKHDVAERSRRLVDETKENLHDKKDELLGRTKEKAEEALEETKAALDEKVDKTASQIDDQIEEKVEPS